MSLFFNGLNLLPCFFRYGTMYILDATTKELVTTLKMNGTVDDVDFTQDGYRMLSIGDEGMVHVWDMNTRQCIHTFVDEVSSYFLYWYFENTVVLYLALICRVCELLNKTCFSL